MSNSSVESNTALNSSESRVSLELTPHCNSVSIGTEIGKKSLDNLKAEALKEVLHLKSLNSEEGEEKGEEDTASRATIDPSWFSTAFITWVWPVLLKGKNGTLKLEDLPVFAEKDKSRTLEKRFEIYWTRLALHREDPVKNKLPNLAWTLVEILKYEIISISFWNALWCASLLAFPLCLQQMLLFIEDSSVPPLHPSTAYPFAAGIVVSAFFRVVSWNWKNVAMRSTSLIIQSILSTSILKKAHLLSPKAKLVHTDDSGITMVNQYISMILEILEVFSGSVSVLYLMIDVTLLYYLVGTAAFLGAAFLFMTIVSISLIGRERSVQVGRYAHYNQSKIKGFRDGVSNIMPLKLKGMEDKYIEAYEKVRNMEVSTIMVRYRLMAVTNAFSQNTTAIISSAIFAYYVLTGNILSPSIVFPVLLLVDLGAVVNQVADIFVSLKSVQIGSEAIGEFLCAQEGPSKVPPCLSCDDDDKFSIHRAKWSYGGKGEESTTSKSNFVVEAPPSEKLEILSGFTGVSGEVGSGKSTLLKGLLGLVPRIAGRVRFHGKFSYAPQKAYIMAASIKDNIIFFAKGDVDYARLSAVIKCCALERDLGLLSDGIETMIGEQGVNLSGGQKARVSLARALYFQADVYLLDDPLSSCDAKVARLIFYNLKSFLKGKKVLFVSHSLQHLSKMDYIINLKNGSVTEFGPVTDLMAKDQGQFFQLMVLFQLSEPEAEGESKEESESQFKDAEDEDWLKGKRDRKKIESKEDNEEIEWKEYLKELGFTRVSLILFGLVLNIAFTIGFQLWLSNWSASSQSDSSENSIFVAVYVILALGSAIATCISLILVTFGTLPVNINRSHQAVSATFHSTLYFFSSNPTGRIIQRLANDVSKIDSTLTPSFALFMTNVCIFVSQSVLIAIVNPILVSLVVAVMAFSYLSFQYYGKTNVVIQRLGSISSSKMNANLNEALVGRDITNVFGVQKKVLERYQDALDENLACNYVLASTGIWFEQRIGISSISLVLACIIAGFVFRGSSFAAAIVGLALANANMIGFTVESVLRNGTGTFSALNSYQRLLYYANKIPQEAARILPSDPLKEDWPSQGLIEFKELTMAYEQRADFDVIKKLSVAIQPGEKVGVVGRTGAGKSTLINAIFRLVEAKEGAILIDGLDIHTLGLHTLRKRIQIIPQEPVLFEGTVRSNLLLSSSDDGEGGAAAGSNGRGSGGEDVDVWQALEQVGMKEYVQGLEGQLDAKVLTEGSNFSHGQRQLLCLARAIICKPRILIMDEATASIDAAADERIQALVKTQFKDTTVISIAHRLASVSDYDQIMVLDEGRLVEYGPPSLLLQDPSSLYSQLASASSSSSIPI